MGSLLAFLSTSSCSYKHPGIWQCLNGYSMEMSEGALVLVPNSSPHPFAPHCLFFLCVSVLCVLWQQAQCEWSALSHAEFTGCEHWSPPNRTMPPTPSPRPAVPTNAINITLSDWARWCLFMAGSSQRASSWGPQHKDVSEPAGMPSHYSSPV